MDIVSKLYSGPIGKDILFANPCKTPKDIQVAKQHGVSWVTVDSVEELEKMNKEEYRPELVVRLRVDDKGSTSPFAAKFGASFEIAKELVHASKDFHMPIVGLSFHIGSGSDRPEAFHDAIHLSNNTWEQLYHNNPMKVLDIGGGWSHEPSLFTKQAKQSRKALLSCKAPQIIAEPGRFFAAPVYSLYVRIIGKKPYRSGWRYTLDESIYGQFSCVPYDHAKPSMGLLTTANGGVGNGKKTKAILFGRTCDSLDWIANSPAMEPLNVGDWLYIPNMGAYTSSTSTEFNGFPKPEIIESEDVPDEIRWLQVTYPLANMLSVKEAENEPEYKPQENCMNDTYGSENSDPAELIKASNKYSNKQSKINHDVYNWTIVH